MSSSTYYLYSNCSNTSNFLPIYFLYAYIQLYADTTIPIYIQDCTHFDELLCTVDHKKADSFNH